MGTFWKSEKYFSRKKFSSNKKYGNYCNGGVIRLWNFGLETMLNKTNTFKTDFSCPTFKCAYKSVFVKKKNIELHCQ